MADFHRTIYEPYTGLIVGGMQLARPIKDGVDYFPLDVSLDEKFELIEAEFGLTGFAVIVKLYQRIYSRGYYCEWTNEVALLFSRTCGEGGNVVSEIVSAAIRRGIFDRTMYEKYQILTSAGIQQRYFEAVSRRKIVNVDSRYLLVECTPILKNVSINWINVDNNSQNADHNSQRRVKERRVDKSRGDIARGSGKNVFLTDDEYSALLSEIPHLDALVERLSTYMLSTGRSYRDHAATLRLWASRDREKQTAQSAQRYAPTYDLREIEQMLDEEFFDS